MDATSKKASAENIPIKQVSSAYSGPVDTFSGINALPEQPSLNSHEMSPQIDETT